MIEYSFPTTAEAVVIVKNRLAPFDTGGMNWKKLEHEFAGLSHAELARMSDDAAKTVILRKTKKILSTDLQRSLRAVKDKQLFATKA